MDRRQKKTEAAILAAFSALLARKNYAGITVQEIIEAADVGRSTFYAHFETKDELLRQMCALLFEHILAEGGSGEAGHDFSRMPKSPGALLTHVLYHLRDNKTHLLAVLDCGRNEVFRQSFQGYVRQLLRPCIRREEQCRQELPPEDFILNHMACSFTAMVQWWAKNKFRYSPEQMARYFLMAVKPLLDGQAAEEPR